MPTTSIACDHIDIGVAGNERERVPYLILPHILPDLPITLLWAEDPCDTHPLFQPLTKLAHRIIFDSESADNLLGFAKTVLALKKVDIADLNWARTEGWRDLITSLFDSGERLAMLQDISEVKIVYNGRPTEFFCHLKIQSMYLLAWLSSRLDWNCQKSDKNLNFTFEHVSASIESAEWEKIGPGTILSVTLTTSKKVKFECARIKEKYHYVSIQISSPDKCDLPYQYLLGQTATGQSLVKEICNKGTSHHYLEMLEHLEVLDKDKLC
jgi:glucose-6-phosphate dehydrogenase assembly protein OpcA